MMDMMGAMKNWLHVVEEDQRKGMNPRREEEGDEEKPRIQDQDGDSQEEED